MQGSPYASVPLASSQEGVSSYGVAPGRAYPPRFESRLPSWTQGPLYSGDDLPGVPLDCFTSSMIDDGSDPAWVPYEHNGCDPVLVPDAEGCFCVPHVARCSNCIYAEMSESPCGSDEEPLEMEVDQD